MSNSLVSIYPTCIAGSPFAAVRQEEMIKVAEKFYAARKGEKFIPMKFNPNLVAQSQ